MSFPERLIACRLAAGLTRYVLAIRLGCCRDTLLAWEAGSRLPSPPYGHKLRELFPDIGDIPERERSERPVVKRKELTTVYLEPGTLDQLRELAAKKGRPVAQLIRRAIAEYLDLGPA